MQARGKIGTSSYVGQLFKFQNLFYRKARNEKCIRSYHPLCLKSNGYEDMTWFVLCMLCVFDLSLEMVFCRHFACFEQTINGTYQPHSDTGLMLLFIRTTRTRTISLSLSAFQSHTLTFDLSAVLVDCLPLYRTEYALSRGVLAREMQCSKNFLVKSKVLKMQVLWSLTNNIKEPQIAGKNLFYTANFKNVS